MRERDTYVVLGVCGSVLHGEVCTELLDELRGK